MIFNASRFSRFLLGALVVFLSACGGGNSGSAEITEGITVNFSALIKNEANTATTGSKVFFNSEGTQITLTKAYLVIWSIELDQACSSNHFVGVSETLLNWIVPAAQAHAVESPTRLSTPNVIDLTAADGTTLSLGEITPPPASYCGIVAELFPADEDAANLPEEIDMIGRTIYIEGNYKNSEDVLIDFSIDLNTKFQEKGIKFSSLEILDGNNKTANSTITIQYNQWFDGLDLTQLEQGDVRSQFLHNVRNSLSIN